MGGGGVIKSELCAFLVICANLWDCLDLHVSWHIAQLVGVDTAVNTITHWTTCWTLQRELIRRAYSEGLPTR